MINMKISASKFLNSLKRVVGTNLKVGTFLGLFAAAISTMVLLVCFKDSLVSIEIEQSWKEFSFLFIFLGFPNQVGISNPNPYFTR